MSTVRYIGSAPAVAQVDIGTLGGTVAANDVFNVTIGNKTLTVTASSSDKTQLALDIASAWSDLDKASYPEFGEIDAQANGVTVVFQAVTKGKPFTISLTKTSTSGTWVKSSSVVNSGPNDVGLAANYSGNALPVDGDTLVVDTDCPSLLYNLEALASVTLASLVFQPSTTKCGLTDKDENGYPQYRPTFFKIKATSVTINSGSPLMRFDFGTAATTIVVKGTGSTSEATRAALCIKGSHASNSLNVLKGSVGVAMLAGETANFPDLRLGYVSNVTGDAVVFCGSGCSLATVIMTGGQLTTASNITSMTQSAGLWTHQAGTCAALDLIAGQAVYNSTGTLTTPKVGAGGILDFDHSPQGKTVSGTVQGYGAGQLLNRSGTVNAGGSLVIHMNETQQFVYAGPASQTLTSA